MARTILIIDDNVADRTLAERLLLSRFADWRLVGIGDKLSFETEIERTQPDLVICDSHLHWSRVPDLVHRLRTQNPDLPILLFSSPQSANQQEELLALQPTDLLTKSSLGFLQLPESVSSALRRSRLLRSQQAMQDSAQLLAEFGLGWFLYDVSSHELFVNPTLASWVGKPVSEIRLSDFPPLQLAGKEVAEINQSQLKTGRQQVQTRWAGQRRRFLITEQLERHSDGRLTVRGLVQEMGTDAVSAAASETNEDLRDFASIAAHQLKEPLRMVERFTDILVEDYSDRLDSQAAEYLRFASDGASRMSRLVDDLLNFSRVESETREFKLLEAEEIVRQAISNLRVSLEESDGDVRVGDLPRIYGDASQLVLVFQNLLENALKFRHPDRKPVIRISAQRVGQNWQFNIEDNGLGIPAKQTEAIFETFKRLNPALPGSGMGLAITRRIIERHGGRTWASSGSGMGASLHFTLPCQPAGVR